MEQQLQSLISSIETKHKQISAMFGVVVALTAVIFVTQLLTTSKVIGNIVSTRGAFKTSNAAPENKSPNGQISATATKRYTIKPNDSLWSIALEQYGDGYKWPEIANANNLTEKSPLVAGEHLDLPDLNLGKNIPATKTVQATESKPKTYTIQKGDSLAELGRIYYNDGNKWLDIWQLNKDKIKNPNNLEAGTEITLP